MNTFLEYVECDISILEFIKNIWEWQEYYDDTVIQYIKGIPQKYLSKYIGYIDIYRGMTIVDNSVKEKDYCSWTTELAIAKEFSDKNTNIEQLISKGHTNLYATIYKKKAHCILLYKIIKDVNRWIEKNKEYVISETGWDIEDVTTIFYNESEVISNISSEENAIYLKPILI